MGKSDYVYSLLKGGGAYIPHKTSQETLWAKLEEQKAKRASEGS